MSSKVTIRRLSSQELSMVSGGGCMDENGDYIYPENVRDNFLVEQFELFQLGHPSVFGPNPDSQIVDPPLAP